MAAEYKMEQNPDPKGGKGKRALHPRLVSQGTVGTAEIAYFSQNTSSISAADMKGALAVLSRFTRTKLEEGYTVYIEGIGYLTPTLQSRPVMDTKELRSESVHFKNVAFRCDKRLKHELKGMSVYKASTSKEKCYDLDERRARLLWYLDRHEYITSTYYSGLNNCSKYSAQQDLKKFLADGIITRSGYRSATTYRKSDYGSLTTEMLIPEE